MKNRQHFRIVPNADGPGWPRVWCSVRGDLGCLFSHSKAVGFRAECLARRLELCARRLRSEFKDAFGISIKHWLVQARSVEVRIRLRGNESIKEIAYSVGFSHPKELSREFLQVYKLSPSAYRQREKSRSWNAVRISSDATKG